MHVGQREDAGRRNVTWGQACAAADCAVGVNGVSDGENIVWGTVTDGENIVWGTTPTAENIVWGTACGGRRLREHRVGHEPRRQRPAIGRVGHVER